MLEFRTRSPEKLPMPPESVSNLERDAHAVRLIGEWTLAVLARAPQMRAALLASGDARNWDLSAVTRLDSAVAVLLWQVWRRRFPEDLTISPTLRVTLERVAELPGDEGAAGRGASQWSLLAPVRHMGAFVSRALKNSLGLVELLGHLVLALGFLCRHPRSIPWKEFSANIYKSGVEALPVSALVGFLIGVTISYLSALQLKIYGADLFIINLLGISIVRELGPVLVAVLVAGRSGSAMTAQIGVMRVTEEIDALATMGVSATLRVALPKVAALVLVMPLLVIWSSASALLGGALAAWWQLNLSLLYFFAALPEAVPVANLWIGVGKGAVFGGLISLLACHFGLHVRPNTESLSRHTTAAVVTAITMVIVADAIFAVLTRNVGMP